MIKAIFFDYGGTLFDYYPSNYQLLGAVAREYGVNISDADPLLSIAFQKQEEYMMQIFHARGEPIYSSLSKKDWINCNEVLLDSLGIKSPEAIKDIFNRFEKREFIYRISPDTINTLRYLKENGFILGIISNLNDTSRISQRYSQLEEYDIMDLFDVITLSGEIGISKPNPQIFLHSLKKIGAFSQHESLFVGDSIFDVLGAKEAGMIPVLLDSNLGKDYDCLKIASFSDIINVISTLNKKK